jgi:DhnA family fructose-bisphosphate aldolase class Ia
VAEELGADMIKTNYPGDPESFKKIVKACSVHGQVLISSMVLSPSPVQG